MLPFLIIGLLLAPTLAGCLTSPPVTACDASVLVRDAVAALDAFAAPEGGIAPRPDADPDPRTTAWVLLAAGLARRTGQEGGFDPAPHLAHLEARLHGMVQNDSPVDSVANNLSLARVAFQAWGRAAAAISTDPERADAPSLEAAWEAHYDPETGRYGTRLNEHLFAAFAAWLFEPPGPRLQQMAEHTASALREPGPGGDPTERDAWWAATARAALGAPPVDAGLAKTLEDRLDAHRTEEGGVRGFAAADAPDASTTAAALLAWQRMGHGPDDEPVAAAITWLCDARSKDGSIPFRPDDPILVPKTTAEVVIALALHLAPIPWMTEEG